MQSFSFAQDIEAYTLIGSRKYAYNKKGERIEKQSFDAENKRISFVHYIFDEKGNKIESLKYHGDSTLLSRYIYIYSPENLRIKSIKCDYIKNTESRKVYINNDKGENVRIEYFNDNGLSKYTVITYTEKGEYESRLNYNENGLLTSETYYRYIYKNNRIVEKDKYNGANELTLHSIYEYDEKGRKHSYSSKYASSRRKSKKRIYQYNSKGQCVRSLVYESIKTK
ncbi:hypothetical protein [Marinifilum sp.]|uniref:hypothetical protein n=1 Tax=Marinifilum sp. TaxID=2033137 RepID=UPI003BACB049